MSDDAWFWFHIGFCVVFAALFVITMSFMWTADEITRCAELPQWCAEEMPRLHAALKEAGL